MSLTFYSTFLNSRNQIIPNFALQVTARQSNFFVILLKAKFTKKSGDLNSKLPTANDL